MKTSKLSQAFEDAFYKKAEREVLKQALTDSRKIKHALRNRAKIDKRTLGAIKRNIEAPEPLFKKLEALSALTAPVLNLTAQDRKVLKSNNANVKHAMNVAMKLAGEYIKDPEKYVQHAYNSITEKGQHSNNRKHKSFVDYLNDIDDRRYKLMNKTFKGLEKSYKGILGDGVDMFFKRYSDNLDIGHGHLDAVNDALGDFHPEQSIKNRVVTEAHTALEFHKLQNASDMNMNYKYWRTQRDTRVRHTHLVLDGIIVHKDKHFNVGGHKALYPGESTLPPEEYFNCRCAVEYQFVPRGTRQGVKTPRPAPITPPEVVKSIKEVQKTEKRVYNVYSKQKEVRKEMRDHMTQYTKLFSKEREALYDYTDSAFEHSNLLLRYMDFETGEITEEGKQYIISREVDYSKDYLERFLPVFDKFKLGKDVTLFRQARGFHELRGLLDVRHLTEDQFLRSALKDEGSLIGKEITYKNAISTNADNATKFHESPKLTEFEFDTPAEASAVYAAPVSRYGMRSPYFSGEDEEIQDIVDMEVNVQENEVIVKPGTTYRIKGYEFENWDGQRLTLEEIHEELELQDKTDDVNFDLEERVMQLSQFRSGIRIIVKCEMVSQVEKINLGREEVEEPKISQDELDEILLEALLND